MKPPVKLVSKIPMVKTSSLILIYSLAAPEDDIATQKNWIVDASKYSSRSHYVTCCDVNVIRDQQHYVGAHGEGKENSLIKDLNVRGILLFSKKNPPFKAKNAAM